MKHSLCLGVLLLCLTGMVAAADSSSGYDEYVEPTTDVSGLSKEQAKDVFAQQELDETRLIINQLASSKPGTLVGDPVQGLRLCACVVRDAESATRIRAIIDDRLVYRGAFSPLEMQIMKRIIEDFPGWRQRAPTAPAVVAIEQGLRSLQEANDVTSIEALTHRYQLAEAIHLALGGSGPFQDSDTVRRIELRAKALKEAGAPYAEAPPADPSSF